MGKKKREDWALAEFLGLGDNSLPKDAWKDRVDTVLKDAPAKLLKPRQPYRKVMTRVDEDDLVVQREEARQRIIDLALSIIGYGERPLAELGEAVDHYRHLKSDCEEHRWRWLTSRLVACDRCDSYGETGNPIWTMSIPWEHSVRNIRKADTGDFKKWTYQVSAGHIPTPPVDTSHDGYLDDDRKR